MTKKKKCAIERAFWWKYRVYASDCKIDDVDRLDDLTKEYITSAARKISNKSIKKNKN
jgi:hypothetical protein